MTTILTPTPPVQMLTTADQRVEAIRTAAGLSQEQFDGRCLPVLRIYAQHVQNLPFSPKVFSRPQGAWEFGLICATLALQCAGTVIFFPDVQAEDRRRLEPQCRYMSFLAVLATCAARLSSMVKVTAEDEEFHPALTPLRFHDWLVARPGASFLWRDANDGLSNPGCAMVAARLFMPGLFEHFDLRVVLMFFDAITSGTQKLLGIESTLARLVRESITRVEEHYGEKESHAFQASEASILAAPIDTGALAKQMASQANPSVPANPLGLTSYGGLSPASPVQPSTTPDGASHAAGSPEQGAILAIQPLALTQPGANSHAGGDPLSGKDQVLKEWFEALKRHPKYPDLARNLVVTDEGVQIPIPMLGMFGVTGPSIRKKMEEAGFVVRRSDDQRCLILIPALRDLFVQVEPAAPEAS